MTERLSPTIVRLVVGLLAVSMLVSVPLSVVGATTDRPHSHSVGTDSPEPFSATPEDIDPDQVRMDVAMAADGSATWTVEFWVQLDDDETTDAFESIADDVDEDPEPYLTRFADRIDSTVATASDATERDMSIDGFAVETERQSLAREYGVIRYTFDWDGFAAVDGAELRAGDAIEGLYLDDGTRLLLSWPDAYELTDVSPEPDDQRQNAVIWRGSQTDFVTGEPHVVASSGGSGLSLSAIAIGGGGLGVVGVVAVWYWQRRAGGGSEPAIGDSGHDATETATADRAPDTADERDVPEEFLSNKERVRRLLEERGGRMKQQDVVSELGWTDAKTSKVVSSLREDGDIESFRLGRENVLSLPDREEQLADSSDRPD